MMQFSLQRFIPSFSTALLAVFLISGTVLAASSPHYLVTNDDASGNYIQNTVTFYEIAPDGSLHLSGEVEIGVTGTTGGYFPSHRIVALNNNGNQCLFASDAATGLIAGIDVNTRKLSGTTKGSGTDTGLSNGIGLALNSQYLYASFTDSNNIGTFEIQPGCGLTFVGDITVSGLQNGIVDGMFAHGDILVVTYGDGSIQSFNISSGIPVSNQDEQNSTGSAVGNSYPSSVDITQDGRFALFGDTSTSTMVEVSDISSGKLSTTVVYQAPTGVNSSNIMLSPDETILYISNTQGDQITAARFDSRTGTLGKGCISNSLKGYSSAWSYLAGLGLSSNTGDGGGVYVAEFGTPSSIAMVQLTVANGTCTLREAPGSPVPDLNSSSLLSIATFPPRSF